MYRKNPEDKLSMWNITIKIDGKKIEPSTRVKYLGILVDSFINWNFHIDIDSFINWNFHIDVDSFLNWNFHIDELSTKLSRAAGMLAKIRHYKCEDTFHGLSWNFFIITSVWFANLGTK